jgi:hypothetical protein
MIKMALEARELTLGYGVTANIAASHRYRTSEMKYNRPVISQILCRARGSSGFDSPYPNTFFTLLCSSQCQTNVMKAIF